MSGWGVVDVRLQPFEYPLCEATTAGALEPSAADDPAPVIPQYIWDSQVGCYFFGTDMLQGNLLHNMLCHLVLDG